MPGLVLGGAAAAGLAPLAVHQALASERPLVDLPGPQMRGAEALDRALKLLVGQGFQVTSVCNRAEELWSKLLSLELLCLSAPV